MGVLAGEVLSKVYAAEGVLALPSRHETFGLVMLEAMACGTRVAAYPVDGPLEVLRDPVLGDHADKRQGGVLGEDLSQASLAAFKIPRQEADAQAQTFSVKESTRLSDSHSVRVSHQRLTRPGS